MRIRLLGYVALLCAFCCFDACQELKAAGDIENFENAAVPTNWQTAQGGELAVSGERFKSGQKSLRWTWNKSDATLLCTLPKPLTGISAKDHLGFWVYNERPANKILRLEILSRGQVVGRCWYGMDFRGWRPLGSPYSQVLVNLKQPVDGFRLIAPKGNEPRRLFIDYVNPRCKDRLFADDQQPWVDRPDILHASDPEKFIYSNQNVAQNRPWLPKLQKPTQKELDDLEIIAKRAPLPRVKVLQYPNILADLDNQLHLQRVGDCVTGRPVVGRKDGSWIWGFNEPADGLVMTTDSQDVSCSALHVQLASAYLFAKAKNQSAEAEKLLQAYFDLCDHLLDQGWVEGNSNVSDGLSVAAVCSMREELSRTGRLRDMLISAAVHGTQLVGVLTDEILNAAGGPGNGIFNMNCDMMFYSNGYVDSLAMFAAIPNAEERLQRARMWRRAMNAKCQPRFGEFLCLDGTAHHHSFFHPAYGLGGLRGMIHSNLNATHGTSFMLSQESIAALRHAVKTYAYLASDKTVPGNVPGYTGSPYAVLTIADYAAELAKFNVQNGETLDREMASVYLAFTRGSNNANEKKLAAEFQAAGVRPYQYPGHLTLNGAAMAAHRRDDWLVVVAGIFKLRRGKEVNLSYLGTANARYAKNGSIFVVSSGDPPSPWASGYRFDGWDGRFQPGATSLLNKPKAGFEGPGFLHSQSKFGGGTDLNGNGVWGMEFLPDDKSLEFRKSVFFFGNRITVITTDIRHGKGAKIDESDCPILTTLFQNAFGTGDGKEKRNGSGGPKKSLNVSPAEEACWIDGREIKEFPFKHTLSGAAAHWLVDNKGTGYFTHTGNPPVRVERRRQTWLYYLKDYLKSEVKLSGDWASWTKTPEYLNPANYTPSEGDFATAWFDHGVTPEVSSCVYTLIPRAAPDAMRQFAAQMASPETAPYSILQKDSAAHILFDKESNTTGYVLFNAGQIRTPGFLREVNRPCWAMLCEKNGRLRLSVASTDLEKWTQAGFVAQGEIELQLAGRWKITKLAPDAPQDCSAQRKNNKTIVTIPYKNIMPIRVLLERDQ